MKREDNKKDKSEDVAEVGVRDDIPLALKRMSNADKIAGKVSFLTTNREDKVRGESASGQQQIKKQEALMQQQQQDTCEPICRIYKVDLTGNFHRCQAAAIGVGADEVEKWMRSRGSYLATKVKVKVKATPEYSSSSVSSNFISGFVNSADTLYELEPAAEVGREKEKGIGADGDNDGDGDEKEIEMIECLGIAECCLREVYRVSDIPDVEVHVATIQGYELWG